MSKRIFRNICAVALLCVLLTCVSVTGVLYKFSFDSMRGSIRDEASYLAATLNGGDDSGLGAARSAATRVTLVAADGAVLYDSAEDPAAMENHAARPEIARAMETGASEERRYSETLATQIYYRAVRLQDGRVLRVSGYMDSVWVTALQYIPYLALILAAAVVVSGLSARYLARRIATPLNEVDLEAPLSNDVYEELSPLLRRMEQQRVRIEEQLGQLEGQRREFEAITANMREGLILLGAEAEVLSINKSALAALSLEEEGCAGRHILNLTRNETVQEVVARGLGGTAAEAVLTLEGRVYQLLANPVVDEAAVQGAVLLLLDVTERQQAEQMRQEFTANVSHELKTPLTSISGFAELMKDGMAKPADIPQFAGRIYSEARRLIALVNDIIRLSQLDENSAAMPREQVNLLELAGEVAARLSPLAEEKNVTLTVGGESAAVSGVPRILEEMLSNLCDNAVKYNRDGGSVAVTVSTQGGGVCLSVADTGIGIPREHRERIFERFYRVDKSHSKETGGTGLGLSIVKHGAILHHARVELSSEEGVGTQVRVLFPAGQA